jgi:hypothetical protein
MDSCRRIVVVPGAAGALRRPMTDTDENSKPIATSVIGAFAISVATVAGRRRVSRSLDTDALEEVLGLAPHQPPVAVEWETGAVAALVRRCPRTSLQALRSRDRDSVSSLPSSNRACGSLAPGFPRSFIGLLSALPCATRRFHSADRHRRGGRTRWYSDPSSSVQIVGLSC